MARKDKSKSWTWAPTELRAAAADHSFVAILALERQCGARGEPYPSAVGQYQQPLALQWSHGRWSRQDSGGGESIIDKQPARAQEPVKA